LNMTFPSSDHMTFFCLVTFYLVSVLFIKQTNKQVISRQQTSWYSSLYQIYLYVFLRVQLNGLHIVGLNEWLAS
jgi:hypothetical protein